MSRFSLLLALLVFFSPILHPSVSHAATLKTGRTLVVSATPTDNLYLAGTEVTVVPALPADLTAFGGTLTIGGPITGDATLMGGTIDIHAPIAGDVRAVGATIITTDSIAGDFMAAGSSITATTTGRDTHLAGGSVRLVGGSRGPVTIYGADVFISGTFTGDVIVVASDHFTIDENTHITGTLHYNAPQQVSIPATSVVDGEVSYTGSSSYLPTNAEAKRFAIAGAGVLYVVKIIALLITAGLVAGFFPLLATQVVDTALKPSARRFMLLALLGFGVIVATPVLIMLLVVSFVGIGIALLLGMVYALLLMLSFLYAGVITGAALARTFLKKNTVSWRTAVLGMFIFSIVASIPSIGVLIMLVLSAVAAGAQVSLWYHFTFPRTSFDSEDEKSISL